MSRGIAAVVLTFAALAAGAAERDLGRHHGVHEIVAGVSDLEAATRVYREVAGYDLLWRGRLGDDLLAAWQLAAPARGRQALVGNPRAGFGYLRLVRFEGVPQVQVRSSARPFDTGGLFNVNMLVKDIDGVFDALRRHGFQGHADPSRYQLFGRLYAGALLRGPDGEVIHLLSRGDRGYEDMPPFDAASHILNATQMVEDFDESVAFCEERLGWHKRWEASPRWAEDGRNNMGLPESLVLSGTVKERAASFALCKDCTGGTVEIFAFEGIRGRDYSDGAQPPNLGLLMYVMSVPDLRGYLAEIAARGVEPLVRLREAELPPYGPVELAVVRAPGGSWLMFVELKGSGRSR